MRRLGVRVTTGAQTVNSPAGSSRYPSSTPFLCHATIHMLQTETLKHRDKWQASLSASGAPVLNPEDFPPNQNVSKLLGSQI